MNPSNETIRWFATRSTVVALYGTDRYTLSAEDPRFDAIVADLQASRIAPDDLPHRFATVDPAVTEIDGVRLHDGYLTITDSDGHEYAIAGLLYKRLREGGPARDNLIAFLRRCEANPRPDAILELYDFLEATGLPIDSDGYFYAYKKVRSDYRDIYSGSFDNTPGRTVAMPREDVDPNRENTCSTGLHFAGHDYLSSYGTGAGTVVVLVRIDPADVVSIPTDYDHQKGRTARYTVVATMQNRIERPWYDLDDDDDDDGDLYD